jgi:hypothetical protein
MRRSKWRTAAQRAKALRYQRWGRTRHQKLKAAGWAGMNLMMPRVMLDHIAQLARQWGVFRLHVCRAALERGLKQISADDAIRAQRQWQALGFGLPVGPLWEGAPCDPSKRRPDWWRLSQYWQKRREQDQQERRRSQRPRAS